MGDTKTVEVYMCGVDWQHEIGQAMGGVTLYSTLDDLERFRPCVKTCGVVKVKVQLVEWVIEQNFEEKEQKT